MQRTAEFDLPLDVDNPSSTRPHAARNSTGLAKHIAAKRHHAQRIDLADPRAGRFNQRYFTQNGSLAKFADTRNTSDLLVDRTLDVVLGRGRVTGDASPVTDFREQVTDQLDAKCQTLLVVGDARRMFDRSEER